LFVAGRYAFELLGGFKQRMIQVKPLTKGKLLRNTGSLKIKIGRVIGVKEFTFEQS